LIVNAIAADRQGQPWVGTNRGGKSRLVANTLNPMIEVIGVQAERAPAAYKSCRARELLEDNMETAAGGPATRAAFELTQRILWQHFDDFVLVSENVMLQAIDLYVEKAHTGQTAALLLSGGKITDEQLRTALAS